MSSKKFESPQSGNESASQEQAAEQQRAMLADQITITIDKLPVQVAEYVLDDEEQQLAKELLVLAETGELEQLYDVLEKLRTNDIALDVTTLDRLQDIVTGTGPIVETTNNPEEEYEHTSDESLDEQVKQAFDEHDKAAAKESTDEADKDDTKVQKPAEAESHNADAAEDTIESEAELDRRLDLFKKGDVKAVKTAHGTFMPTREIKTAVQRLLERSGHDFKEYAGRLSPYTKKIGELSAQIRTTPDLSATEKRELQQQINQTHELLVNEVSQMLGDKEKGSVDSEVNTEAYQAELEQRIADASNFTELIDILWECKKPGKGVQDGQEYYDGVTLVNSITDIRDGKRSVASITNACGLRKKVEELQQEYEKIKNKQYVAGSFTSRKAENFLKNNHQGMEVKVARSSGDIEDGWHVMEIKDGYAAVIKSNEDGGLIKKNVSVEDLQKLNVPERNPEWLAWNEARKEHLEATAAYEQSLVDFYKGLETQKFGTDKLKYMAKKAVGIKPELTPELQRQREAMLEKTAAYNQAAQEQRAVHLSNVEDREMTDSEREKQQKILERYQRMYTRTVLTNSFHKQLHAQETALAELPVNERYQNVKQYMSKHRTALRYVAAGAIGGATGGLAGGAYLAARVGLSALAGAGAARLVMPSADKRVEKAEQVADTLYEQTVANIEHKLQRTEPPLQAAELKEAHDTLFALYDHVDDEKRRRIMKLVAASAAAGLLVGFGTQGIADWAYNEPEVQSPDADTPRPTETAAETKPETEVANKPPVPEQEPTPAPEAEVTETVAPTIAEESFESFVQPEVIAHELVRGDTVWDLMERYSDRLNDLSEAEKNNVLMQLRAEINSSEALQEAAGIRSGQADLIYSGDTLQVTPLLEELDKKIDAIRPPEVVSASETTVANNPPVSEGEPVPVAEASEASIDQTSVAAAEAVSITSGEQVDARITDEAVNSAQAVASGTEDVQAAAVEGPSEDVGTATDTEAYQARKTAWIEEIQGPVEKPGFFSSLMNWGETTENPFAALKDMTIKQVDALAASENGAEQLQVDEEAFAAWVQKLKEWRADDRIEGISPNMTFGEVADKAFYQQTIETDLLRYAK